jgi:heme/copper-type cytochrome/quinol oxidase subunit 2
VDALLKYAIYVLFIVILFFMVKYYNLKTKRQMKTVNITFNRQTIIIWVSFIVIITGITLFLVSMFSTEHVVMVTCRDGTDEPVNATKYIYCGEDIRPYTIEEYMRIKMQEAQTGAKPININFTTK